MLFIAFDGPFTCQTFDYRLILLGSSHYKHFNEFASNEAIIMTEIYEYARSLFDPKFSIAHFQHYKFLLATRILDYGQHFRCTNYLEQIARHIELKPESYDSNFIQRVRLFKIATPYAT